MTKNFFDKKLGNIPDLEMQKILKEINNKNKIMTKIEEAAEKYVNQFTFGIEHPRKTFIKGATHVQETELKEARELIEELRDKLKKMSVRSFSPSLNEIFELANKAETFLNK